MLPSPSHFTLTQFDIPLLLYLALITFCFLLQFSPEGLLTWENMTGGEAGDSGIINMEDEDDDLSDQVRGQSYKHYHNRCSCAHFRRPVTSWTPSLLIKMVKISSMMTERSDGMISFCSLHLILRPFLLCRHANLIYMMGSHIVIVLNSKVDLIN